MALAFMSTSIQSKRRISLLLRGLLIVGFLYIVATQSNYIRTGDLKDHVAIPRLRPKPIEEKSIPQKIWQTWHTPATSLADEDRDRVTTWHEKNPHYQYELVTDRGAETFVRNHFATDPLVRDVFLNLTDAILRADFLRYLLLLAEGGVYADLDVECKEPIDTWVPLTFQGKANVVLGIEVDRKPVENDVKLYYDHREYIWGITNWTLMAKRGHPLLRFVAETVANNLLNVASKQGKTLSTMQLSYKEVIDATGPRAFTEAFLAYASETTGTQVTYLNATMLEESKLIDDVLLLPIRAFSMSEASRSGIEGARSEGWPTLVYHWSAGTWKKTHFQRPEEEMLG